MRAKLRAIRKQHGWSAEKTAAMVGLKKRMYLYIESGARNPSLDIANRLEDVFRIPQRQLLEQSEEGGN